MNAIKIGVAGTHSTGKSTFVQSLAMALSGHSVRVGCVADLASEAKQIGFPILRDHTFSSTLWIMTRGISEQLSAGIDKEVVLVDRPALDAIGYLWAAMEHRRETLGVEQTEYLLSLAQHDAATYQLIFKTVLDPTIPLGQDRDDDPKFRAAAGRQIDAVFSHLGLSPQVVVASPAFVEGLAREIVGLLGR